MNRKPFVHSERSAAQNVRFTDEYVIIDMVDGRAIGMPLYYFPWLEAANDAQRQNYELHGLSVYWEVLDEGIDLIAMLTGLYSKPKPAPESMRRVAM